MRGGYFEHILTVSTVNAKALMAFTSWLCEEETQLESELEDVFVVYLLPKATLRNTQEENRCTLLVCVPDT